MKKERKFTGVKKVAGETKRLNGWNGYVQAFYDTETDEMWCEYFTDKNWYTTYHSTAVISNDYTHPATMAKIKKDFAAILNGENEDDFSEW